MTSKVKDLPFTPSEGFAFIVKYQGTFSPSATSKSGQVVNANVLQGDTQFASLSSNQITIQPGTYVVSGVTEFNSTGISNIYLRVAGDISLAGIKIQGVCNIADGNAGLAFPIEGVLNVVEETAYELFSSTVLAGTHGVRANLGVEEVYSILSFIRI